MITLAIDTSFYHLVLALIKDDEIIDSVFIECHKRQSEITVVEIEKLLCKNSVKPNDIGAVVVSKGPGSYTGVRIAMTIAKVYSFSLNIPLYTVSTLLLYAGIYDRIVCIDARSSRVYLAIYSQGSALVDDRVLTIDEAMVLIKEYPSFDIYGDGTLLGKTDMFNDISKNFLLLKDQWLLVDNVHELKPEYLKDTSQYGN